METHTIFFVGKPGCGKGTQAELLAKATGWPVVSSGHEFRALAAEDTLLGRKVKAENDAGILQPHWFATYLFLKSLFDIKSDVSVIFDGFNRKVPEAETVISSLNWLNRSFVVMHIKVSDDTVRLRLEGRSVTSGRADDHVVEERLKEFYEYTEPTIEVFRDAGVLVEVDGEQTPEEIAVNIRVALALE